MAFNVKKSKRLPSPQTQDQGQENGATAGNTGGNETNLENGENGENGDETSGSQAPSQFIPNWMGLKPSNVVATQSWVFWVLKKFWDWTRFFATKTLHVAGGLNAGRVKTGELQAGDIYAKRIMLLDPEGNPAVLHINGEGKFQVDYEYKDAFFYPGVDDTAVKIQSFVYRFGTEPEVIARNFVGLTPFEIMLNFVPFESNCYREMNGKVCYKLCEADGVEERIDKTLLVTCPHTKKIVGVEVVDKTGEFVKFILDPQIIRDNEKVFRKMTINMPSFKAPEIETVDHIILPGEFPSIGNGAFRPFVPPYLLPPVPPVFIPPVKPTLPPTKLPPALDNDIFDEDPEPVALDDIFQELGTTPTEETEQYNAPTVIGPEYEVVYNNYALDNYFNIVLARDSFEPNKEQYLKIIVDPV